MFRHRRRNLGRRSTGTCGWGNTGADRTWWVEGLCEQFDDGREEVEGDEGNSGKIRSRDFPWVSRSEFDGVYGGSLAMIFVKFGR